ncbi:THUMP domain-containing class I SAM-dependent RNA methyltransferase [Lactococcus termiticola]|uniref:RNA methyltransferase n=1 Tax=Lactococcus termiticola TaxID=2169526 RepID=A0A2R5HGE8_9LACT|nr:class I SAM-dependent RNA methyltransferase [Lactococcus termiticola]GBG97137.1 RNA methyltransferase [Lactococcus termiticola]
MKKQFKLNATAAAGIESLVARELKDLDFENVQIDDRSRVFFEGGLDSIAKANLWLRTADRVKIVVGEFKAKSFEELFDKVYALDWEEYIPFGSAFPVSKAKAIKSTLHNEPSVQSITKKAIVKKLQTQYHRPEGVPIPENGPVFSIEIALYKDVATLYIDTTGDSLFKRGYRQEKGEAPLKENMAAAIIKMTNWLANPKRPLVDPTCGSGTFTIEATMAALNMAPGLHRKFAAESWPWMDEAVFNQARNEARAAKREDLELDVQGFDIDGKMVAIAKSNAFAAGLGDVIKYKQMRLQDFKSEALDGVIISNPPYGERMGDEEAVIQLYKEMGETFAPIETWSKYILTSDLQFEGHYGQKATKKRKLYNGTLRTDLYMYFGKRIKH